MKDFRKGCYRIKPAGNGDVTIQLKEGYISPENLCAAALGFLKKKPDYYLGSWIEHPDLKNVLYTIYRSGGSAALRFHSRASIAGHPAVDGYVYLDHHSLDNVLRTMALEAIHLQEEGFADED